MTSRNCDLNSSWHHANHSSLTETKDEKFYVFLPVPNYIKIIFAMLTAFLCIFGVTLNALVLAYKLDDLRAKKTSLQLAFRRQVMCFLMISLSSSDIVTAFLGEGTLTVNFFVDVFQTRWPCKLSRFILVFSAVISINNLLLISFEKYLGIFHWKKLPSESVVRWSVVAIWLEAALASLLSLSFYDSVRVNLVDDLCRYTLICDVVTSVPYNQASFITIFFFAYFIPISFVSFAAVAIIHHIRARSKQKNSYVKKQQLKNARLIVDIIAGFVIPYALIILYHTYRLLSHRKLTFLQEYIYRYISTILVISNCVINPIIYYRRCDRFRQKFKAPWLRARRLNNRKKKWCRTHPIVVKSEPETMEMLSVVSLKEKTDHSQA